MRIGHKNYTELKLSKKDFLSLLPVDYIVDFKGGRSGFATTMASWTAGVTHGFNELVSVRPEVRYEHAFSARPWDNGQRKDQFMFAIEHSCVFEHCSAVSGHFRTNLTPLLFLAPVSCKSTIHMPWRSIEMDNQIYLSLAALALR